MLRRTLLSLAAAVATAVAVVGPSNAQEPVTIRFGYNVVPAVISPLLFQRPEILKHYGKSYTVDPIFIRASSLALQALAADEVDVTYLAFASLANGIASGGVDMKVIADVGAWGSEGHQGPEYVVLEESGIETVEDLRGKILGVSARGTGFHYAMVAMLKQHGMEEGRDYTVVEVQIPAMEAALRSGRIDLATTLAPFLFRMEEEGGIKRLFRAEDAMGDVQSLINVARTGFLEEHGEAVVDFLEDYIIALRWFLDPANHDEAVAIAADFTQRPPEALDYAFTELDFYRDPRATPNVEWLQNNIDLMYELGVLRSEVDVEPWVDLSYLNEAKQRLGLD